VKFERPSLLAKTSTKRRESRAQARRLGCNKNTEGKRRNSSCLSHKRRSEEEEGERGILIEGREGSAFRSSKRNGPEVRERENGRGLQIIICSLRRRKINQVGQSGLPPSSTPRN